VPYCTPEDVRGEIYLPLLQQLAARFGDGLDAQIAEHVRRADDYIDTILCRSFDVPISPVPPVLTTISAKLAAFYVTARHSEREEISKDRHDAALEMLGALVKAGRFPGAAATPPEGSARSIRGGSEPRWFDERRLRLL